MFRYPPCSNCGRREFEEDSGIITCVSCGRQQEGGLQIADDLGDFGTQGKVVRQKIEKTKIKVTRIYRGKKAYRLYLQVWQHILWRQMRVMVCGPTQAPEQLWQIARDLWTVWLSKFVKNLDEDENSGVAGTTDEAETSGADTARTDEGRAKAGLQPKLWDTLALIYVSALLLRFPITLHEIYELIRSEEIPFLRAIRHVPEEMSSRLPPEYQQALDTLAIPTPRELSKAVWKMLNLYSNEFGISFPAMNWRPILLGWIRRLALPIEVYAMVKEIIRLLHCDLIYDIPIVPDDFEASDSHITNRRGPVVMAEVKLMCALIIAIKFLFPFFPEGDVGVSFDIQNCDLGLDWSVWRRIQAEHELARIKLSKTRARAEQAETKDADVLSMSAEELDSYMDWYQATFVTSETMLTSRKSALEKNILDMFPIKEQSAMNMQPGDPEPMSDINETSIQVQNEAIRVDPGSKGIEESRVSEDSSTTHRSAERKSRYEVFPTIDSLSFGNLQNIINGEESPAVVSSVALYLHEHAAQLVCLDLNRLVKAVRHMERKLEKLVDDKKREATFGAA